MDILSKVKKIPGGMMVVPLLLGALTNTFFPQFFELGGFTEALFKSGSTALLGAFLFCNGAQINVKQAGTSVYKGVVLLITKVGIGAILGILVNHFFGVAGILGLSPLAIISSLTNKNGGLYAALAGEYGDSTDVGATSIIALSDGPFFTMIAFGATGLAEIPISALLAAVMPILIGFILGNLDENIRTFLEPGTSLLIPFFAFPLGAGLNLGQLVSAGASGIILGIMCVLITGIAGYFIFRVLKFKYPQVGAGVGATAGNAVGTPVAVAAIDPGFREVASQATAQVAAAIIVTAIICPFLVSYLDKHEKKRNNIKSEGAIDGK
ncbi:MAG: 2-keto-3-deoxygluconate permease [Tetragenococcus koreensis]|nr:2-keto-3-deoxygluconate permease [Tetragenococcus koreensis]MDN6748910.1 2-keto-3-deoxygluconate permease [Staphylococcus equorum]MDN6166392.1 2-keto-3-deoxygluconate permease [Tetragenococcus koreensis]MDN6266641.1 2-keto-3-deoxygluconate permease [Tetragenococcus koreensis]MDN6579673.1 2-keto-3-deoxygluconate permease [Tetragenococcus koreensis]